MNRQLKFRVWDTVLNKFEAEYVVIKPNGEVFVLGMTDNTCIPAHKDRFVVQQYTGLFDSKGTPIYEGDIIRDTWKENRPYSYSPDEEYDCNEVFEVIYKDYSFNLERKYGREQTCVEDFQREVIGNIFETPNLLKL